MLLTQRILPIVMEELTNPSVRKKQRFVVSLANNCYAISKLFICCDVFQESEALNLYKEALALRLKKDFQTALQTFHQTLALSYVENVNT